MASMPNWLTFSLSPMEMLRSSDQSQFVPYDASSAASPHYLVDNFYGWTNQKPQELFKEEAHIAASMADSTILTTFIDPQTHTQNPIPKLEDFLGDSSSIVRYSDSQTDTQDSSLTQIYDTHHHHHRHATTAGFFSDHHDFKAIAGFQSAFSTNSGSEVDDSASIGRTHLAGTGGCGEFLGHVVESSGPTMNFPGGCNNGGALSLRVNKNVKGDINNSNANSNANADPYSCSSVGVNMNGTAVSDKAVVAVETSNSSKKISDTFGQRTSIYRGVTRHRWTGRYEAHLWDNSCRREGQARKGRQVYLGGYDKEDKAARAYDLAALKYWGSTATTNFPISNYTKELEEMKHLTKQEFIASLRRKSSGFSRGASIYRGVTRHHQQGRWQARIGRVAGNKDLYLGTFATEEEAAEAYDIAAIKFRGVNAVTNFEMSRYDVETIMKSALPIGGAAKRLKLSLESTTTEQKPVVNHHLGLQQLHSSSDHINFALATNTQFQSQIPVGIPSELAALYHHHGHSHNQNLFQHFPVATSASDSSGSNSTVQASMALMAPNQAEFFLWPNQSY